MKRVVIPELLDTDAGTPEEVADSLADLEMFNRFYGGVSTMADLLRSVAAGRKLKSLSWLDVAGGQGTLATRTGDALAGQGLAVRTVILDRAETHMDSGLDSVCGDALHLPFRDNSFDVVGCCLFLHHLEPPEIVAFVREALRVARHAVVINDLIRHPVHLLISRIGRPIYRSRITRHDAVASVRRAYTVLEIKEMLGSVPAQSVEVSQHYLFRMGVIAWKRTATVHETTARKTTT
jgi:ubiquinone/menaquinone biosynthesis C-methylase UbiE